jgi:phospholipase/carboxylesterase
MTPHSRDPLFTRRRFIGHAAGAVAVAACGGTSPSAQADGSRFVVNPVAPTGSVQPGVLQLGLSTTRDGLLYVPPSYDHSKPTPLVLGFHGAGGSGNGWLNSVRTEADAKGFLVLAPDSREQTWDAIRGRAYGPDVDFVNSALEATFQRANVDATRMAIGGFSDGATYALSVGLANGDYFPKVIAFSPGFVIDATPHGRPKFFIAHGTNDTILPIDNCSRRIVPILRSGGYDVTYHEFAGGHRIDEGERANAFAWMLGG